MNNNELIMKIKNAILNAEYNEIQSVTKEALDAGMEPKVIMKDAISAGLNEMQERIYQDHKVWFTPDLFLCYEAARKCIQDLEPYLKPEDTIGTFVLGSPKGDPHDVGAKWLAISLIAADFKVVYLGRDVSPETFFNKAIETDAQIIGLSCHQTTGFQMIEELLDLIKKSNLSKKIKIMAGGSVITEKYAKKHDIGYAKSAPEAVRLACEYVKAA